MAYKNLSASASPAIPVEGIADAVASCDKQAAIWKELTTTRDANTAGSVIDELAEFNIAADLRRTIFTIRDCVGTQKPPAATMVCAS